MAATSWLLFLIVVVAAAVGSRMVEARPLHEEGDAASSAIELQTGDFNETLWAAPAVFAIVEFYAHWCPACRLYKPQYERVAKLFNGRNAPHPGELFLAKVDCAHEANSKLCARFSVQHYPSLFWGAPGKLAWSGFSGNKDSGIEMIDPTPRTSQSLLDWINKRIGKSYSLSDETPQAREAGADGADIQPVLSLQDIEMATSLSHDYITREGMLTGETRVAFSEFLHLLAVHHPSKRCRKGSAELLVNYDDVWLTSTPNTDLLGRLHICNRPQQEAWETCRGSINGTRGYSCGLWLLFHALSVRVDDGEGKLALQRIRSFVQNFFRCEECREHFLKMSSGAVNSVNSRRDLVLWLWRAHNEVNERVGKEEAQQGGGDPAFPKRQWPSQRQCGACRSSGSGSKWNETAVYEFMLQHYGRALNVEPQTVDAIVGERRKEVADVDAVLDDTAAATGGVSVPVGAAVGIAMASCGFGLVACYWRSQQKRRKLLRRRM